MTVYIDSPGVEDRATLAEMAATELQKKTGNSWAVDWDPSSSTYQLSELDHNDQCTGTAYYLGRCTLEKGQMKISLIL